METAAYWTALATVVAVPPFLLVWFIIHPFARQWRKLGPAVAYPIVLSFLGALMVIISLFRRPLLSIRFGVRWPLAALAVALLAAGSYLGVRRLSRLSVTVMFGLPEVSPRRGPGRLIREGIYARIRHPRYVEAGLFLASVALFCNYLATYVLVALYVPVIYLVVLLEERELRDRFGQEYERYCRDVPRFIPGLTRRANGRR